MPTTLKNVLALFAVISASHASMPCARAQAAGDLDNDGIDDLVVGVEGEKAGSIAAAAAQVVSQAIAAARAAAQVRSPSRVFMGIGLNMGAGLALGMEKSGPRVERAADTMISSVAGIADQMTSTFSDAKWASDFGAKVENSLGDTVVEASDKDVVGQLRALNGNVDQSTYFATLIAEVRALRQAVPSSGSATGVAATARTAAALGAF